jgi:hypothetical protein
MFHIPALFNSRASNTHCPVTGDKAMCIDLAGDAAGGSSKDATARIHLAAMRGERFIVRREFERFS